MSVNANPRQVARVTRGMPAEDGAGVKLTRLIGTPELPDLDPILMLDNFGSDDPKADIVGFPRHPHRGFETEGDRAVLGDGDALPAAASGEGARLLIVAGKPLREPIAKYGPFVMNTQAELRQAVSDFQRGLS